MRQGLELSVVLLLNLLPVAIGFVSLKASKSFIPQLSTALFSTEDSLVVISPPGGVGEVAAVEAAGFGTSVRWFVVNSESAEISVALSSETLETIEAAGGKVELAGANAASLLLTEDSATSAISAVEAWCGSQPGSALVCTSDGATEEEHLNALKVAAEKASSRVTGTKVAILSTDEAMEEDGEDGEGLGGFVGNLVRGNSVSIPDNLKKALGESVKVIRHGSLLGVPESSPDFSPLIGGPMRTPQLCQEWQFRSVRVDKGGNPQATYRQPLGQLAALVALGKVEGLSTCALTSLQGSEPPTTETWETELDRVRRDDGSSLFVADDLIVADTTRLAEWFATKWAPAILRTYDIAAIRTGARPVYAQVQDAQVEIVWQELIDFKTSTVGKMILQVSEAGVTAVRQADKPLNGEDVLVRRLSEALAQAVEKGLAKKVSDGFALQTYEHFLEYF